MGGDAGDAGGLSAGQRTQFGQIGDQGCRQDRAGARGGLDASGAFAQVLVGLDALGHGLVDGVDIGLERCDAPVQEAAHGLGGEPCGLPLQSRELVEQQAAASGHFLEVRGDRPGAIGPSMAVRHLGGAGDQRGVDAVRLGARAGEAGEGAHVGRVQAKDAQAGEREAFGRPTLIAAGGLQRDHGIGPETDDQPSNAVRAVGHGEGLAGGVDMNVELVHRDVDADKAAEL